MQSFNHILFKLNFELLEQIVEHWIPNFQNKQRRETMSDLIFYPGVRIRHILHCRSGCRFACECFKVKKSKKLKYIP